MKTRNKKKLRKDVRPKIVVFACNWGVHIPGNHGEIVPPQRHPGINLVRIMCSGRLSPALILQAFELGADGVLSLSCPEGECHYSFGEEVASNNFTKAVKLARILGIGERKLRMKRLPGFELERVEEVIDSFVQELENLR